MQSHPNGHGSASQHWIARDSQFASPSYTRMYPLVVDHALGSEIWDVDGRRYIDFMAGIAVLNVGHRHPYVVEKVKQTIDQFWHICHADFYVPQAIELAEKLAAHAPMHGHVRTYLGNSGTEAVEAAIKLAMYHTGRRDFIGFRGGFHGRTLGALSFTSSKYVQRAHYRKALQVYHVPFPNCYRPLLAPNKPNECVADSTMRYIRNVLFETTTHPADIAAVLIEPIQGEGGYVLPATGFMRALRELCDEHGILLIVDEIQSGAGRTGKMWAVEHEGVEPDIVCFAKGIGSGLPIGGILAKESVMTWKPGAQGSTFGGNPVTCSAALATIEVIEQEGLMAQAAETGAYLIERLREMQQHHPSIGDVRGRGLMVGVEFVGDRETKEPDPHVRDALAQHAFDLGLLLLPCGKSALRITPPLNISRALVDEGLKLLDQALTLAERDHPYHGDTARAASIRHHCTCGRPEPTTVTLDSISVHA